jgi:transcriptional regulator with XRE-family HTH domain
VTGPATARRRLRTALRDIRLDQGLSDSAVGHALGWLPPRLPGIEQGEVNIGLGALRSLLAHYHIVDDEQVDRLVELRRLARKRHWSDAYWQFYSRSFRDFLSYEDDATSLRCFHPRVVPGLLQTEAYARALQATTPHPMTHREVEARVKARMRRQHAILAADRPIQVIQIALTEPALLRPVSDDHTIMATQLDHLAHVAQRSRVDLTLIPADCDMHTGVGPFVVLRFNSAQDPDLVYRDDAPHDSALSDIPSTVERYQAAFADLRAHGISGQRALARLAEIRGA